MTAKRARLSKDRFASLYEMMVLIRRTELQVGKLFADGLIPGSVHLCIGQEAVPAGVMSALAPGDTITSTHRGHGHVIAKGTDLAGFFKEIMGRAGGVCGGRGGSMHVADMSVGILGANGIVGGGIPIALGNALAHRLRRTGGVAVAIFGDGARAEGVFHESLNISSLWGLPLLFVCENNKWAEFSPASRHFGADLGKFAGAFGLQHARIDGNDVAAVSTAAEAAVASVRNGGGPFVLECVTLRLRGHYEGDPQKYRDPAELTDAEGNDPIIRAAEVMRSFANGDAEISAIEKRVDLKVEDAVRQAKDDPPPDFRDALRGVYTAVREA